MKNHYKNIFNELNKIEKDYLTSEKNVLHLFFILYISILYLFRINHFVQNKFEEVELFYKQ